MFSKIDYNYYKTTIMSSYDNDVTLPLFILMRLNDIRIATNVPVNESGLCVLSFVIVSLLRRRRVS